LLPAISVILKIRKRKLINLPINTDSSASNIISIQGQVIPFKTVTFDSSLNLVTSSSAVQNLSKLALTSSTSKTIPLSIYSNMPSMLMI
jgi:hypothetical protein